MVRPIPGVRFSGPTQGPAGAALAGGIRKLGRQGRNRRHRGQPVHDLTGRVAAIDTTTTSQGRFAFTLFAALAEFERDLIVERTKAGLASARARGRKGGRPYTMTTAKLRTAMAAMGQPETHVGALCRELGVTRQTLYRHVGPKGELRPDGEKLLAVKGRAPACG